jgi:hypothetical protein
MRSPSLACCRLAGSTATGDERSCCRWLLCGALLLLGLTGALGAQAAGLPQPLSTDPRPGYPAVKDRAATLLTALAPASPRAGLSDEASVCQALTATPAGTTTVIAGATGLPAGTFRGVAGELPTAAEPPPAPEPPLVTPLEPAAPLAPADPLTAGAPPASPLPTDTAAAATSGPPAASAAPGAAVPTVLTRPAPEPHPALAFDVAFGVPRQPFGKLIYQISRSYALNPLLVAAIAKVESDFNPRARSRKGACGLMQVLPSTARRFGLPRRRDLFNPRKNLEAATRYLRWLVDRFGDDPVRVLAAYNAGEGAVDRFGGVPPFAETRDYVQRIFGLLGFSLLLDPPVAAVAPAVAATAAAVAGAR